MKEIEFEITPDGMEVLVHEVARHYMLTEEEGELITMIFNGIKSRYPDAHERLIEIYGHSPMMMFLAVKRFVKCNFGNGDEKLDIEGDFWNLEKVRCPLRGGFCPDENIICMPRLEIGLTKREMEVLKLANLNNKTIADRLFCSIHTVENHLANISQKLNIHGKPELVRYANKNNIIK